MNTLFADNTMLSNVATCERKTLLHDHHGFVALQDAAALRNGAAIHYAMEAHFAGGTVSDVIDAYLHRHDSKRSCYEEWAKEFLGPDDRLHPENVIRVLKGWVQTHPVERMPYRVPGPRHIERGFMIPLATIRDLMIVFCGRLDLLALMGGEWWVVEHKSAWRTDDYWLRQWFLASQPTGYAWAAQELARILKLKAPVRGVILNAIHIPNAPSSAGFCKTHSTQYAVCGGLHANHKPAIRLERSPAIYRQWRRTAIALATRFDALRTKYPTVKDLPKAPASGMFTYDACGGCGYLKFCRAGCSPRNTRTMLRHDPWSPFDHAKDSNKPINRTTIEV